MPLCSGVAVIPHGGRFSPPRRPTATLKRSLCDEGSDPDLYLHTKKMLSSPLTQASSSTAINPLLMHYPHMIQPQMQLPTGSAFEGIPIFIVPQNGISPPTVSFAALQRANEIKATLAASAPAEPKVDTSKHHHIFVGDLSPEVDNRMLKDAFSVHGEVSEAKVIRDSQTQKSKGYGFVSFPVKEDAEKAMPAMNGQWVGRRAIRTNWATRKPSEDSRATLTFEQIFNSTKADNTSVYVGNISQATTENDLRDPFSEYGTISEVRLFKAQGYAFVRFEAKECATHAIMGMNGKPIAGNSVRVSWGRVQSAANPQPASVMPDLSALLAPSLLPSLLPNPYFNASPFGYPSYY